MSAEVDPEEGAATLEFLAVTVLLLVPIVYLILTLGRIEAATFAAEASARDAGRLIATADSFEEGVGRARVAVELAFADQGLTVDGAQALTVTCDQDPCLSPGGYIHLTVSTRVGLPVLDAVPGLRSGVDISAEAMTAVNGYRGSG